MEEYLSMLSTAITGNSSWSSVFSNYRRVEEAFRSIARPKTLRFLDLGCGLGLPLHIAKAVWGGDHHDTYKGIEVNEKLVKICAVMHSEKRVICDDFRNCKKIVRASNIIYAYYPFEGFEPAWVIRNMSEEAVFIYMNETGVINIHRNDSEK